jgi:hypothetical protein
MMIPVIKNILYTTDMSETSNYAFGYAASLANRYDALITIVHVLKNPMPTTENLVTNVLGEKNGWKPLIAKKPRLSKNSGCDSKNSAMKPRPKCHPVLS